MKRILFFAILVVNSLTLSAQDILVRKSGEVENVRVLEVSPTEVKYKKSNNGDGPTFIEKCSNLYSIKYMNGEVQTFHDEFKPKFNNSYYSKYGKEKLFTHEVNLYIQDGWGAGYAFRGEITPYLALNIFEVSYLSNFCNPMQIGIINARVGGLRFGLPIDRSLRVYTGLSFGFSYAYVNYKYTGDNRWYAKLKESLFGLDFCAGFQLHKNVAIGYDLNFIKNKKMKGISHWGKLSILF